MVDAFQTVVETIGYLADAQGVFTAAEREELDLHLAANPSAGDLMPGTVGARKRRWAAKGKGKRGGARVITYFADRGLPVFSLACFAKGEKTDMSPHERAELRTALKTIADEYRKGRIT
jgi:hypothetical protein